MPIRTAIRALAACLLVALPTAAWADGLAGAAAVAPSLTTAEADAKDLRNLIQIGLDQNATGDLDAADRTWAKLRERHPTHPAGWVFQVDTLSWRKSLDFTSTRYDDAIEDNAKVGLERSQLWLKGAPDDRDALFYAGQSYVALMKLNGMQGNLYRAGTQGESARKLLERALEVDPDDHDAKYALGSYYYFASIATRYIRWLTWLWFVPTGEREQGLEYVEDAATKGDLTRFEASATFARIGLYMEDRPELAAPFIESMLAEHPESTYLQFELVELRMMQRRYEDAIAAALALEATTRDDFGDAERREAARIWRARAELLLGRSDAASVTLGPLEANLENVSPWSQRWILLTRAQLQDLHGDRDQAIANYEQVIERQPKWGSTRPTEAARSGLETPYLIQGVSAGPVN